MYSLPGALQQGVLVHRPLTPSACPCLARCARHRSCRHNARQSWRVHFKVEDREEIDQIRERLDELRHQDRRERLLQGEPATLEEVTLAVAESRVHAPPEQGAYMAPVYVPAFTRRREIFVGRFAMVGFMSACIWETILSGHPGILQQVAMATHEHPSAIATCFLVLATCNAFGASAPWAPTWQKANLLDVMKRPPGPPVNWVNPVKRTSQFLGLGKRFTWGFTKANELLHGRFAMLGFAVTLINEVRFNGAGPIAQVARLIGLPINSPFINYFYSAVGYVAVSFVFVSILLAYSVGQPGSTQGDDDIY